MKIEYYKLNDKLYKINDDHSFYKFVFNKWYYCSSKYRKVDFIKISKEEAEKMMFLQAL